jgi:phage anti-repressor protein
VKYQIEFHEHVENEDFILLTKNSEQDEMTWGGSNRADYYFTLDAAKEIAMASRSCRAQK